MTSAAEPVGCQRAIYDEMLESARDYFEGDWHTLPIQVRIMPLLCGSTGAGKTFLVRRLAQELGIPLFTATLGDWILLGANGRGSPQTLPLLYKFIERNERAVIFLDEIEKLGDEFSLSDWRRFLQIEVFSILDRNIVPGVLEQVDGLNFTLNLEQLTERFTRSVFLVAAGAWQSLWTTRGDSIGFAEKDQTMRQPTHAELAATLRLEILNRFSHFLMLPPFSSDDYRRVFAEVMDRVPPRITAALPKLTDEMIEDAVQTQKGFRFFEALFAGAVRRLRLSSSPPKFLAISNPEIPDQSNRADICASEPTVI